LDSPQAGDLMNEEAMDEFIECGKEGVWRGRYVALAVQSACVAHCDTAGTIFYEQKIELVARQTAEDEASG
jgi:hypothetical protein